MLETEDGDDFDSDDNDALMDPIQGHWVALSIPDGCQMLETKDDDLTDPIHVHWAAEMGKRK